MSTREIVYGMIDQLDDEQLNAIRVILGGLVAEKPKSKKRSAASLCGIFQDVADPDKTPLEKGAWEQAAVEKHIRITEESVNENS